MSINDLSDTIIAKSDQLNAADLMGAEKIITITNIVLYGESGDKKFYLNYQGDCNRPYKPSMGMRRLIMALWGKDGSSYIGRSMRLYRDATVVYGGKEVGGIIVGAMSDIKGKATVTVPIRRGQVKEYAVEKLEPTQKPAYPDAAFSKHLEAAKAVILDGSQTNEQIITKMEVKATLTDEQKRQIREIGDGELNNDEDDFLDE